MEFYSRYGDAICYCQDGQHVFLWDGSPVAFLSDGKVYSFTGAVLGWFDNGWLYDRQNAPALFSASASGGPVKPVRKVKPVKSVKRVKPVKGVKHVAPVRPVRKMQWSSVTGPEYFQQ